MAKVYFSDYQGYTVMWVLYESYKQLYIKRKLIFEWNYEFLKQNFGLI